MICAIVLAAGKSERMGKPKALLPLRGKTFLENILAAISSSPVEETCVVVGHHQDEIEPHVKPPARLVFNPDYEQGMITSFQAGIRCLPSRTSGALLFLVAHPLVDFATFEAVVRKVGQVRIVFQ